MEEHRDDWGEWMDQTASEEQQDTRTRPWKRFQTNETAEPSNTETAEATTDEKVGERKDKEDNEVHVYNMDAFYAAPTS